jgi:hypothetical protein
MAQWLFVFTFSLVTNSLIVFVSVLAFSLLLSLL